MRRFLVIASAIAILGLAAAPLASACSNLGYANGVTRVNTKALYATDLMSAGLFNEGASAMGQAVRQHSALTYPCSSAMRQVRSTYHSGLLDWYAGTLAAKRGNIGSAVRYMQRGTAKVKYATNQLKLINS